MYRRNTFYCIQIGKRFWIVSGRPGTKLMYHGSVVTELIFSNQSMTENHNFTSICGCMMAIHVFKHFHKSNISYIS